MPLRGRTGLGWPGGVEMKGVDRKSQAWLFTNKSRCRFRHRPNVVTPLIVPHCLLRTSHCARRSIVPDYHNHHFAVPMDPATRDEETGDAQNARTLQPQPRQRGSVPSFLFLSFILFMLTSHNGDEFLARHQHQDALQALTWQLGNYSAWMNGTESNFTVVRDRLHRVLYLR